MVNKSHNGDFNPTQSPLAVQPCCGKTCQTRHGDPLHCVYIFCLHPTPPARREGKSICKYNQKGTEWLIHATPGRKRNKPKHSYMKFQIGHRLKGDKTNQMLRKKITEKKLNKLFGQPSKTFELAIFLIATVHGVAKSHT